MSSGPIFCDPDRPTAEALQARFAGAGRAFTDLGQLHDHLMVSVNEDTVVLGPGVGDAEAFQIAEFLRVERPSLGVVLVRRAVTTPLLQEALRSGVFEVVDERDQLGLESAVKRSFTLAAARRVNAPATPPPLPLLEEGAEKSHGRIVTVFSAKGGCGKTTLATNLAAGLADKGRHEVCLVDLDLAFGDVAIAMQLFPAHTIADAVPIAASLDARAVSGMLTHHSPGLKALVAPTDPSLAESIEPSLITQLLEILRREFDYVVVDTPPAFDDKVLAALDVSDLIALIVTPDVPALKNLKITLEMLFELSYPRERCRLALNRADSRVGITHSEVEATAQMSLSAQIPSSRDVPSSINRGVPIVLDDPKHPVSVAIRTFGEREVLNRGDDGSRRGWRRRPKK